MKQYIGTKVINALPMNRLEYNQFRGWELPKDENGADEGYLVEYVDGGKSNTQQYAGYVSWSPKEQFDNAYRATDGLSFGLAIEAMQKGMKVARSGWNGKGMYIALSPGMKSLASDKFWAGPNKEFANSIGGSADVLPCFTMKTATGEILMGWLASQTDILATDYEIAE